MKLKGFGILVISISLILWYSETWLCVVL